jgi:hypothetical protein
MKTTIYILGLILLLSPLHAQRHKPAEEPRTWTDVNGRTMEATYGSASQNNTVTVRRTSDNKKFELPLNTLSQEDRDFVYNKTHYVRKKRENIVLPASKPAIVTSEELALQNPTDRYTIPSYAQKDFPKSNGACGPTAIFNYLLWWGEIFPKMPAKTDNIEKTQRRLLKYGRSNRSGINYQELAIGISSYFKHEVPGFDAEVTIVNNPSNKWFIENTQGLNGVVACYTNFNNSLRTRNWGHFVSVINTQENSITFNSAGSQYTVELTTLKNGKLELTENHHAALGKEGRHIMEYAILIKPHRTETP